MHVRLTFLLFMVYAIPSIGQGKIDTSLVSISHGPLKPLRKLYEDAFKFQTSLISGSAYAEYESLHDEHPYFGNDDWFMGSIDYNGTRYENVPLQFDIQFQKVLLEHPASAKKIELVKEKVASFSLDTKEFISLTNQMVTGMEERFGFFEVLARGEATLLCQRKKSLQQKTSAGRVYPVFQEINKYYLLHDKKITAVNSRRNLLKIFSAIEKAAAEKIRKQKIKPSGQKEHGFTIAVNAFNEALR